MANFTFGTLKVFRDDNGKFTLGDNCEVTVMAANRYEAHDEAARLIDDPTCELSLIKVEEI